MAYKSRSVGVFIVSQYIFVCELLYVATTAMIKLSIGAFFLRPASKRYQRIVNYTMLAVVTLFSTIYLFFLLFQCRPVDFMWKRYQENPSVRLGGTILANVTLCAGSCGCFHGLVLRNPAHLLWVENEDESSHKTFCGFDSLTGLLVSSHQRSSSELIEECLMRVLGQVLLRPSVSSI
jgi:hypothetical protein